MVAATKKVRWSCPNDARHSAVLGPSKPRRNNVCRYCLVCSSRHGVLVERVAPVVEKKRVARKERTAAKAKAEGERRDATHARRLTVAGIRVDEEVARLWKLPVAMAARRASSMVPHVHVRRAGVKPRTRLGHAYAFAREIQIVDYPGITANDVLETLAHEVAHCLTPSKGHGVAWKTAFRLLCEQRHGVRPVVERRFHGNVVPLLEAKSSVIITTKEAIP